MEHYLVWLCQLGKFFRGSGLWTLVASGFKLSEVLAFPGGMFFRMKYMCLCDNLMMRSFVNIQ